MTKSVYYILCRFETKSYLYIRTTVPSGESIESATHRIESDTLTSFKGWKVTDVSPYPSIGHTDTATFYHEQKAENGL